MGDFISMSEALLVAVVSILVVFLVLIVIAIIINGLKAFSSEKKPEKADKEVLVIEKKEQEIIVEDPSVISEELVAVITAAVAVNLGANIPEINIKSIRRMPQMTSGWSNAGNIKQVSRGL